MIEHGDAVILEAEVVCRRAALDAQVAAAWERQRRLVRIAQLRRGIAVAYRRVELLNAELDAELEGV